MVTYQSLAVAFNNLVSVRKGRRKPLVIYRKLKHEIPQFRDSAYVRMRSSLFWDVTRRRLVVIYRRFGITSLSRKDGK
jgi:hypothetical protein